MTEIKMTLRTPQTVNFIGVVPPPGVQFDGNDKPVIHIADLTDEQLEAVGRAWTAELIAEAKRVRENRKTDAATANQLAAIGLR